VHGVFSQDTIYALQKADGSSVHLLRLKYFNQYIDCYKKYSRLKRLLLSLLQQRPHASQETCGTPKAREREKQSVGRELEGHPQLLPLFGASKHTCALYWYQKAIKMLALLPPIVLLLASMSSASDLYRQSIIFHEETPEVFYCPQDKPISLEGKRVDSYFRTFITLGKTLRMYEYTYVRTHEGYF